MRSLYKILEIIIGTKETIRRGFASGLFAGIPIAVLITVFFVLNRNFGDAVSQTQIFSGGGLFVLGYMLLLLTIIFLFVGSRAVGWLFTRPLAAILEKVLPEKNHQLIWGYSNALVWTAVSTLILMEPLINSTNFFEFVYILSVLIVSAIVGFWGGRKGFVSQKELRKKSTEKAQVGGIVTGTLIGGMQTINCNFFALNETNYQSCDFILGFFIQITFWSVVCIITYRFINILVFTVLLFNRIQKYTAIVYITINAVVWIILSYIVFSIFTDEEFFGIFTSLIGIGFCGACGGFAMSQFHNEENKERHIE